MPAFPPRTASVDELRDYFARSTAIAADHARYLARFINENYLEPAGIVAHRNLLECTDIGDHFAFWLWDALGPALEGTPHPPWLPELCADVSEFARLNDELCYAAVLPAHFRVAGNELVWSYFTADICEKARSMLEWREQEAERRAEESGY